MNFSIERSVEILERTPEVLKTLLNGLSEHWTGNNEGPDTWSPYDVIGHLIHGERTDWMTRIEIILSDSGEKKFTSFDRFAQFEESKGKTLLQLLDEFSAARRKNIQRLKDLQPPSSDYSKTGIHPSFGEVTLQQLISAWVVHDLDHLSQIARIMAKQYKEDTGPWLEYLKIIRQ